MTTQEQPSRKPWYQYRNSLPPNLLDLAYYLQTRMMSTLLSECGHTQLRLGFAPYITLIGERHCRPTELAEALGISRQACNQGIRQIEKAGYVSHIADPDDGRAKLLSLTQSGRQLRRDGVRVVAALDEEFAALLQPEAAQQAAVALTEITNTLTLGPPTVEKSAVPYRGIGGLLPRIGDFILQRLMALTATKGHPGLKLSFGQVIPLIGAEGGRIQQIAAVQDVSKQAISAIATELEKLGYLRRENDPNDARQIVLRFTQRGEKLMTDSTGSVDELEGEFAAIIGSAAFEQLTTTVAALHRGLGLGAAEKSDSDKVDIKLLAQQLRQQLGQQRSLTLARLLANPN